MKSIIERAEEAWEKVKLEEIGFYSGDEEWKAIEKLFVHARDLEAENKTLKLEEARSMAYNGTRGVRVAVNSLMEILKTGKFDEPSGVPEYNTLAMAIMNLLAEKEYLKQKIDSGKEMWAHERYEDMWIVPTKKQAEWEISIHGGKVKHVLVLPYEEIT